MAAINEILDWLDEKFNLRKIPAGKLEHHPEGNLYNHLKITVDKASKLTNDFGILLACLLHDIGKVLTPKEEWPRHFDHDKKGVDLAKDILKQLGLEQYEYLVVPVVRWHMVLHKLNDKKLLKIEELKNKKVLDALDTIIKVDAGKDIRKKLEAARKAMLKVPHLDPYGKNFQERLKIFRRLYKEK